MNIDEKILDKLLLFILEALFMAFVSNNIADVETVVIVLFSIIISLLVQSLSTGRTVAVIQCSFCLLCLMFPKMCFGMPLLLYDAAAEKKHRLYPIFTAVTAAAVFSGQITGTGIFALIVCLILSVVLASKNTELNDLRQKLKSIRDDSQEINMLLKQQNRSLIRSQDYEIYLATLKERNRIAREIHDNVGHIITRCLLQISALMVTTKNEEQISALAGIKDSLGEAMTSIRLSVHDLHDDSINLRQSVGDLVSEVKEKFHTVIDYDCSDDVPKNIKLAFLGILKEALNNAAKYSSGDEIHISVQEFPAFYRLIVKDNGANPEIKEFESDKGIGMSNMKERVRGLNGIFHAECSQSCFKIFASAPKNQ